jgi:prepilin-type N-terminal cleavage/methylation domain-containing protein
MNTAMKRHQPQRGFSLIELLVVIAILAIVARALVPNANTGLSEQLEAAAHVLAADLDYARTLAVTYESNYKDTFDTSANSWTLKHTGTDTSLNTLPPSPFQAKQDPTTERTTRLQSLPGLSLPVAIYGILAQGSSSPTRVSDVEFGSLGSTTRSEETVIWLVAGAGAATRYVDVRVNPVTGLTTVGNFQSTAPTLPPLVGATTGTTKVSP